MRPLRVFVDTSVFGGLFDEEFEADTRLFFNAVDAGRFRIAVSEQVIEEIKPSPEAVRGLFNAHIPKIDIFRDSPEIQDLADLYLREGIITPKYRVDALFVACASVNDCAGLISWNFSHIVHEEKSRLFNLVNVSQGYPLLFIATPREMLRHVKKG